MKRIASIKSYYPYTIIQIIPFMKNNKVVINFRRRGGNGQGCSSLTGVQRRLIGMMKKIFWSAKP